MTSVYNFGLLIIYKTNKQVTKNKKWAYLLNSLGTRGHGNVRTHIRFRPRSSTFLSFLATKRWRYRNFSKTYISFRKQPIEYDNATLEGR